MKIGFIGAGNMGRAIINGWLNQHAVTGEEIYLHSTHRSSYEPYAQAQGLHACASNEEVVNQADLVFLAIKPAQLRTVLLEVKAALLRKRPVIVSMIAGCDLATMRKILDQAELEMIRIMPNVNVEIAAGMTALTRNEFVTTDHWQEVVSLFDTIGTTIELAEDKFSIFAALAGSSPAFIYFFIDALARAGVKYGLDKVTATQIAAQVVQGSAQKTLATTKTPWELVDEVCSPGGTTVAGLLAMEEAGFMTAVIKGIDATVARENE